ncbi:unnamed protein product (macronuclear) [Paramecium tetraurelia]|uniref:FCP1 homology domain-containing protein n=1 Tax=Paramecium tetraurelia TaxID=5888 RepID=A0CDH4_PARTE|nr:uncharacterized protein GSPATT00007052001 [Paramecium tetraurelia]CAK68841.1 unnamed protein product [Paramecium tetraurelia]|eukprot:XP_001436238.1 hypothetical protein (macronuclear) [Paramecium tetraurelia strain d4-2]
MLRNNGSVANIQQTQSTTSLLQALVNSRPKSSQKRIPSAKNTIIQQKNIQRCDPKLSLPEPPKSTRTLDSDKKQQPQQQKRLTLIQRTMQNKPQERQRIDSSGQKEVPKEKEESQQTIPDIEIPKQVTVFALSEQDQNTSEAKGTTPFVPPQASAPLSKYVMRLSKGANIIPKKQQDRKRMNSPVRRATKENLYTPTPTMSRDTKMRMRSVSPDRKLMPKQSLGPQSPFNDFEYYMSFLRYFHNKLTKNQIKQLFNQKTNQYFLDIYQDHFQQSYHALQYCKDIVKPSLNAIANKIVNLPENKFKKTIVFDLDETLIHCQESNDDPSDTVLTIKFPTGETVQAGINLRPYCREMLAILSQKYEIIVFTASHECYAQKVINYIDPDKKWIHHRFFRESCVVVDDGLHIKDLRVLGNRNLKDLVLVDNASYSFCFQIENGVPIIPFYDNSSDRELQYLTTYLLEVMQEQDIPSKNLSKFKTNLYQESTIEHLLNTI